jgi:hypothetical protein
MRFLPPYAILIPASKSAVHVPIIKVALKLTDLEYLNRGPFGPVGSDFELAYWHSQCCQQLSQFCSQIHAASERLPTRSFLKMLC